MTMFLVVREIKRLHEIYQTSENELERRRSKSIVKNTMGQLHKWCWTPFSCCLTRSINVSLLMVRNVCLEVSMFLHIF